jgi:hypothetical protein
MTPANVNRRIWRFAVKMAMRRRIGNHVGPWRNGPGWHFGTFAAEVGAGFPGGEDVIIEAVQAPENPPELAVVEADGWGFR